jgi:hypothetical protein
VPLKEKTDPAYRRMPCDSGGRDWSYIATGQGMPRLAGDHQVLGEGNGLVSLLKPSAEANSAYPSISDFWTPELQKKRNFYCFKLPSM